MSSSLAAAIDEDEREQLFTIDSMHNNNNNNNSNWTIQMFFIGSFAVLSGAVNLTVIAVILLSCRLRRSPHLYVANVLLLALVRALASLPLRMMILSRASEKDFSYQELDFLCKLFTFASILSQFGIVYAFVAISLDRYLTVVHGRLGVQRCSGLLVYFPIMLCVWGLAFVTALLEVYGHADDGHEVRECRKSSGNMPSALSSVTVLFLLIFSFCCVSSNLFYLRIYFFMRHYRKMRPYLEAPQINDGWTDPRMIAAAVATSGGLRWPLPMMSSVPNPTRSLNLQTPPPSKRALVGVCALLNFISVFLWLPSLISTFGYLSSSSFSSSSSSVVHAVNGYYQFLFSKVKSVTDDDDDSTVVDGHVLFVVGIVTSWLELVHILIVPVFYVCTCSMFRKEVLKIRSSNE